MPDKLKIIFMKIVFLCFVISVNGCSKVQNENIIIKVSHNGSQQHPHQAGFEKLSSIIEMAFFSFRNNNIFHTSNSKKLSLDLYVCYLPKRPKFF